MTSYLIDTNVFLEIMLQQKSASIAENALNYINNNELFISDFSLHSIGVILSRLGEINKFTSFITDLVSTNIKILSTELENLKQLVTVSKKYNLDFDDAYQYVLANLYDLQILSFDADFDNSDLGITSLNNRV